MHKLTILCFVALYTIVALGDQPVNLSRDRRTVRAALSTLGLGPWCVGCPSHFCDDDPHIIQGYCCGCARIFDYLPITCSPALRCPLNIYELCLRYEYMMHCCCAK